MSTINVKRVCIRIKSGVRELVRGLMSFSMDLAYNFHRSKNTTWSQPLYMDITLRNKNAHWSMTKRSNSLLINADALGIAMNALATVYSITYTMITVLFYYMCSSLHYHNVIHSYTTFLSTSAKVTRMTHTISSSLVTHQMMMKLLNF